MVQGELFTDQNSASGLGGLDRARKPFLSRHQVALGLDKLLLIFIAFVVMFALTYSFGVERGKRAVEKNFESLLPEHTDTVSIHVGASDSTQPAAGDETVILVNQNQNQLSVSENTPISPEANASNLLSSSTLSEEVSQGLNQATLPADSAAPKPAFPIVDSTKKGSYTIQLVTYGDEKQAVHEIDLLKAKGHAGFVIPSGSYYQVCANYFEDKAKAKSFLKQFSEISRYPGAYIRPVIR